jgi:thiamine biosynthesis protein ThiS
MICVKVQLLISNERGNKEVYVAEGETLSDLMTQIGINRNDCIFVVNGEIKHNNYLLKEGDNVKVFQAMVGG